MRINRCTIHQAAKNFLCHRGYTILDEQTEELHMGSWSEIVAYDNAGECLVFCNIRARENYYPEPMFNRERAERDCTQWLASHDFGSSQVRFDQIDFNIISGSKGLIRHWVGAHD